MLSLIYSHFKNQPMLDRHFDAWEGYSESAKKHIRVLICDDCSPELPRLRDVGLEIRLYRLKQKRAWNWIACRNRCMAESPDEWRLMTDMDHLLEPEQAENLVLFPVEQGKFYMPQRRWPDGSVYEKRHPNTFLVHRDDFFACGGYDEDFSGYYGSDSTFRRNLSAVSTRVETDAFYMTHYEGYEGANCTDYGRKRSEYHAANVPALQAKRKSPPYVAENVLGFDWERIQ